MPLPLLQPRLWAIILFAPISFFSRQNMLIDLCPLPSSCLVVRHLQLPSSPSSSCTYRFAKTNSPSLYRLCCLHCLRHRLQLSSSSQDLPPSKRDPNRLHGRCPGGHRDGRLARIIRTRAQDAYFGEWVAGFDVFCFVAILHGSVSSSCPSAPFNQI